MFAGPGTNGFKDWICNLSNYGGRGYVLGLEATALHTGFYEEALAVFKVMGPQLKAQIDSGKTIIFDGHSRNDAVNGFVMCFMYDEYGPEVAGKMYLVGVAGAPVFGPELAARFNEIFPGQAVNIFDVRDPVQIPTNLGFSTWGASIPYDVVQYGDDGPELEGRIASHYIGKILDSFFADTANMSGEALAAKIRDWRSLSCPELLGIMTEVEDAQGKNALDIFPYQVRLLDVPENMVVPEAAKLDYVMILKDSARAALADFGLVLSEDLVEFFIDPSKARPDFKKFAEVAAKKGAKIFAKKCMTQLILKQLDLSGMSLEEKLRIGRLTERCAGIGIGCVIALAKGDTKAAAEMATWGALSAKLEEISGYAISMGPSNDVIFSGGKNIIARPTTLNF